MKDKILEVKNLSFTYEEENHALKDISIAIYKNEKIAVLGANGSGKSTFFLNLNGVRQPDEGEIYIYEEKISKKTRNKLIKNVGIIFQDADSQLIASTVRAEVAFGPLNMKLPPHEVERRTDEAIDKLGLQQLEERPPHYLSGGEKKRVCIADIIAMETEIIIFDEPTASLDPMHVDMLENILEVLWEEGKTILVSTHDVDFAYRFADRILIFHEGELIANGKPQDIFEKDMLLQKAHLKKPVVMRFYDLLLHKNIIKEQKEYPRTIREMERLIINGHE